ALDLAPCGIDFAWVEHAALAVVRQLGKLVAIDRAGEHVAVPATGRAPARQRHENEAEHHNRQDGEQDEDQNHSRSGSCSNSSSWRFSSGESAVGSGVTRLRRRTKTSAPAALTLSNTTGPNQRSQVAGSTGGFSSTKSP